MNLSQPKPFLSTRVLVSATLLFGAVLMFAGYLEGDVSEFFGEGRAGTFLSILLLLMISYSCFKTYRLRPRTNPKRRSEPRLIWFIIGAGFFYLALDDALLIHENIDNYIHTYSDLVENDWSGHIDDLIIMVYGMIGVAVLYVYRAEIGQYDVLIRYLVAGFMVLCVTIGLDIASNGLKLFLSLGMTEQDASAWKKILRALEELSKLVAEAVFLSGFFQVVSVASEDRAREAVSVG